MKWLNKRKPVYVRAFHGTMAPHHPVHNSVICLNISRRISRIRSKRSIPLAYYDAVKEIHELLTCDLGSTP